MFGSLLNGRNQAETQTAVGAVYDPSTDTWHMLPPSALSPQATSAVWIDGRLIAWDYETASQGYDPVSDRWSAPIRMPLRASECYPDSAVVSGLVFAWYCAQAAVYDEHVQGWQRINGGPLSETVYSEAHKSSIHVWRFATLVSAGPVLVMSMEGITLAHGGEACYGCLGSPRSCWLYRPPNSIAPDRSFTKPTKGAVRRAVQDYLSAWLSHDEARLQWLATSEGLARFRARVPDLGSGTNYRVGRVRPLGEGFFNAPVSFVVRDRALPGSEPTIIDITLVFGPGNSIGGDPVALALVHVRR